MPWIASQVVDLQVNCSTHEVQRQKNSCHRKCCGFVVGSMSCQWQNEDFGDHDRQPVGCQQPDTSVSDQTTTDAQDRQSWTQSVVGRAANAAAVVQAWCGRVFWHQPPVTIRRWSFADIYLVAWWWWDVLMKDLICRIKHWSITERESGHQNPP